MKRKLLLLLSFAILVNVWNVAGQNMPFPQNKIFTNGLMPTNRSGADASSNYSIWKSNWTAACGDGRYRVKFDDQSQTVSEGIGYGLLMAAYAGDKTYFDGFWTYYKSFRNTNGVMHWKITGCSSIAGQNGATDAELDGAMALIVAHSQWGSTGTIDYQADAKTLISIIKNKELESGTKVIKPGDQFGGSNLTNPSYFAPAYFRVYGKFTNDEAFWNSAADKCYEVINANLTKNNAVGGLVSDWCRADGTYSSDASGYYNGGKNFHYDAVRTPWRIAMDYLWFGTPAAKTYIKSVSDFIRSKGGTKSIRDGYNQNGNSYGTAHNCTFVGGFACAAMGGENQSHLDESYADLKGINEPTWYFNQTLKTLYLYLLTGNLYNPINSENGNILPTISITAPAADAKFTLGTNITISANASDADGTVSKVEFFQGTTKLGEDLSAPYSFTYTPTAAGTVTITVKVTDDKDGTASANVTFKITDPSARSPYGGTPAAIPGRVEIENYDVGEAGLTYNDLTAGNSGNAYRTDDVDIEATTDAGAGYAVGYTAAGEWLEYTVNVASTADYDFKIRVAGTNASAKMHVEINGVNVTGSIAVPSTGGWQTWQTVTVPKVALTAGKQVMRVVIDTDGFNLNYLEATTSEVPNSAPVVSITAPLANASFTSGSTITITADASDADGSVAKVEFYQGTTKLGEDATSPYSFAWTNVAAGTYSITAKATDDKGTSSTSTAVSIVVNEKENAVPTVTLTAPASNSVFTEGESITITANASDADGSVAKVEFYQGTTKLGEDATSPYSFTWTNAAAGTYLITAKATDDKGASVTSAAVSIVVNEKENVAPTVTLTAPASNSEFTEGGSITITANASDADGSVAKVEFYQGTNKLGEDATSPYSFTWTNAVAGTYSITAKATDDKGASSTSSEITVIVNPKENVPPVVSLVSPAQNATFEEGQTITITADASDEDGTVAKVEFYLGTLKIGEDLASPFSITWTEVSAGGYSIIAKAIDDKGAVTTSSAVTITVNSKDNVVPVVSISAPLNNASFVEGTSIEIKANASDADGSVSIVEFYQGATKIGEAATSPYSFTWSNVTPGTYEITAKATDDKGISTISEVVTITVTQKENEPPVVSIDSPAANAEFSQGETINITVTASDADGSVAKVEFYQGTTKIGEDASSPYSFSWTSAMPGSYSITAKATDDKGAVTTSASIDILVKTSGNGIAPTVTITSPATNSSFEEGRTITINADAADSDGTISKVEYYQGTVKIGEELLEPYSLLWNNALAGTYSITVKAIDNSGLFTISDPITIVVTERTTQRKPYNGTPAPIPGRIEAEDFDLGGQNLAYYDDTQDNKGGQYRTDEYVDIEDCAEGGHDVGYMDIGEWLDYTVDVKDTGKYELGVRVGSPNSGKVLHVEMAGVDISGPITVPNTGNWQQYTTVKIKDIQLTPGVQTMRIVMDSAEFNINYVEFRKTSSPTASTPYKGTPLAIPGRIEAEDFDLGGAYAAYYDDTEDNKGGQYRTDEYVDIENCGEGGYDIGYMDIGEWLKYTVDVKSTDTYNLGVRVASPYSGRVLHVELGGVDISGPVTVPNTGSWQNYTTVQIKGLQLTAGVQIMKIVMDSAEFNLNYVEFKKVSSSTTSTPYKGTPLSIPGRIEAEDFDLGDLNVAYYDDTQDNKGGQYRTEEYVDIENCSEGGYDVGYMDIGEWLNYTVDVKAADSYNLNIRVASPNSGKVLHVELAGVDISGPVTVPNTGSWQTYATVQIKNITLTAGIQMMKIVMDSAEFNLNYVEFKSNSSTTVSTPFKGIPSPIPGRIEAEDFDLGGLNMAYYDDTQDNKGGQYRNDEYVDIENCSEGGYNVAYTDIDEWLNYTVDVKDAGSYNLGVRVASQYSGKVFHVELGGINISGPIAVPNTGGWQNFTTVQIKNIQLKAGVQVMKIVMDAAEFNLNYVEFKNTSSPVKSTPYKGSPIAIPGKIEAEDFDLGGLDVAYFDNTEDNKGGQYRADEFVDIENCAEGGYNIGYMDIGEWLNYSVEVKATGAYDLGVRVATQYSGKLFHIEMDGVNISGSIAVPTTGDWQKYATAQVKNIQLVAGLHTLTIVTESAEFNINYIEFSPASTSSQPNATCELTETPEAVKFVIRNDFTDQNLGAGLSNENGALKVSQRQWGQTYLYVIENGLKHAVEAGKAYTISFDFKDDAVNKVSSIETGFATSIEWYGAVNAQELASIGGTFSSSDFTNKSVTFNALSTGNYYLVIKLNWDGQPNAKTVSYIKNLSICKEVAMASSARASIGMSIAGPNPFDDETLLSIPFSGNGVDEATVSITDVYGKPVTTYTTSFEGQLLPVGKDLIAGTYFVTVTYAGNVYTSRVIKN